MYFDENDKQVEFNGSIYAIDYDGTIDFAGYPNVGKIDTDAVNAIKKIKERGNHIILWTCRFGETLEAAVNECRKHGIEFDAVNDNLPRLKKAFKSPKIVADFYIDDRGVGFGNGQLKKIWDCLQNVGE